MKKQGFGMKKDGAINNPFGSRGKFDENGEFNGTWETHYTTGELSYRINFHHGQRHGLVEDYSYLHKIVAWVKGEYKSNKRIGLWYATKYD